MKAIRPIFDNLDDLDDLEYIDGIDMMACLFTHIRENIAGMEDIDEAQRQHFRRMTNLEITGTKIAFFDMDIIDIDANMNDCRDEYPERMGTEFNELIVMFEIVRWLQECGYEWDAAVDAKYRYIAEVLGINSKDRDHLIDPCETGEYVLNTESRAFHELKLMLPLHWATILLDWYPISILGIDGEEAMVFGNLVIVCI
jgi:hypothetical protein